MDFCIKGIYWFGKMAMLQLLQSLPQKRRGGKERRGGERSGPEDVRMRSLSAVISTRMQSSYIFFQIGEGEG
jgi:hypothetical protein